MHLTMPEIGAYVRLMGHYWRLGDLPSEAAPEALLKRCYAICGARNEEGKAAVRTVLRDCFVKQGDTYVHPQLDEEIAIAVKSREQRIEQGRKGGLESARQRSAHGQADAQATLKQPELEPEPESESEQEEQHRHGVVEVAEEVILGQGLGYLMSKRIPESKARKHLDDLAKLYSNQDIAQAVTITIAKDPRKPLGYITGILRNKSSGYGLQ
jgi:uncharacterized protein YdaU (DUF1376 family)